jgi:hypothetical protein
MTRRAITLVALALVSGCAPTSAHPSAFEPAHVPYGVQGTLRVGATTYHDVELLAVQDSGYVVLTNSRIGVAPFRDVSLARFRRFGYAVPTDRNGIPTADAREQLRFLSRFPYGIPAPAMAALLQHAGQQAPDTLGAPGRP